MLGRVIIISSVVFACGYGWHRHSRNKERRRQQANQSDEQVRRQMEACMEGVWSEPRQLIADIQSSLSGPGEAAAQTAAGRVSEVSLTPQAQRNAWAAGVYLAAEGGTEDRDAAIRLMLQNNVAPLCDWLRGYEPYAHDPRFRDVYESTGAILDLAELSLKYGSRNPLSGNGALIAPGWVHKNPAPSADVRQGDYVEVMVDRFSGSPTDDCRYAEWAWVRVDSSEPESVTGTVTFEAPPGAEANPLRNAESHGFSSGVAVAVPRRCVHRVVHGR